MSTNSNIRSVLQQAITELKPMSISPRFDAEILMAHVLEVDRAYLITHSHAELEPLQQEHFNKLVEQRKTGQPIAYILGKKGFWTFELSVNEHTLVPRPETEILVEQALKLIPENQAQTIADICTGTGAIGLAIALERPMSNVHATDIDGHALEIACINKDNLKIDNIELLHGDLYSALPDDNEQNYDMIVSNPPYIDKNDSHLQHITMQHEPRHALIAEDQGMAIIEKLLKNCKPYLKPEGFLLLEHGHDQKQKIENLCKEFHLNYIMGCQDYQALDLSLIHI